MGCDKLKNKMKSENKNSIPIDITFFVPCYNEEENVIPTLETIKAAATAQNLHYEILVVDDGSVDQTYSIIEQYLRQHSDFPVTLLKNEINKGLGYSYMRGAAESHSEHYIYIPGDNCTSAEMMIHILKEIGKADIIIPYLENPQIRSWFRRAISFGFTALVNLINGKKIKYYNGLVMHKRKNVLRFKNVGSGFAYQAEMLSQLLGDGCSYLQIPYKSTGRKAGKVSALRCSNIISVIGSLLRIFKMRFSKRVKFNKVTV